MEALFRYWGNDEHKMKMDDNKTMTKTITWKIKETMNTHSYRATKKHQKEGWREDTQHKTMLILPF